MNLTCSWRKIEDEEDLPRGFRGETIKGEAVKKTLQISVFEHRNGDLQHQSQTLEMDQREEKKREKEGP